MFAYDTYIKTDSCREVCRQFRPIEKLPGVSFPHRNTVRNLVKKIPIQYMKDCLKPIKDEDSNFKGGDWVRVIRGLYKYDLGMVSCVDNEKKLAQVYVVPRINNGCQEQNYDRFYGRPKARIYPAARIQGNGKTLDIIHGFFAHDNNILTESGFLVQIFQFSSLKKEGVIPNKDELHQFRRLKALPTTTLISVGDKVMMMNGDYKDLTGEVMDVKMPFATVLPHSSALPVSYLNSLLGNTFNNGILSAITK
ncbi:hypothetical protein C0J52_24854 [Blattella germanica]|nr:hypothetical protein C0J52_24854 [Blattella germanica]